MNRKHITREEAEQFSKELYKELIAYNWTGNIDRLINDIIPYQTPQSYAELLNM